MLERVREALIQFLVENTSVGYCSCNVCKVTIDKWATQIFSIKVGNHTLKEIIEMIDEEKLVKLAKDQRLPELPHPLEHSLDFRDGALRGMEDMLKIGFHRVEPLKGKMK